MTENDIINLIAGDEWMMDILRIAEKLNFPDWVIGGGFVRNKVWDYLHGYAKKEVDTADIDLVYYDPNGNDPKTDKWLSQKLRKETGIKWEIVNQYYAHKWWNNLPPYQSTEDSISKCTETATCFGVKLTNGGLKLVAPYGVADLVNLIIRPSPNSPRGLDWVKERARQKKWLEKWPKLKFGSFGGLSDPL